MGAGLLPLQAALPTCTAKSLGDVEEQRRLHGYSPKSHEQFHNLVKRTAEHICQQTLSTSQQNITHRRLQWTACFLTGPAIEDDKHKPGNNEPRFAINIIIIIIKHLNMNIQDLVMASPSNNAMLLNSVSCVMQTEDEQRYPPEPNMMYSGSSYMVSDELCPPLMINVEHRFLWHGTNLTIWLYSGRRSQRCAQPQLWSYAGNVYPHITAETTETTAEVTTRLQILIALLCAGIEPNPGPMTPHEPAEFQMDDTDSCNAQEMDICTVQGTCLDSAMCTEKPKFGIRDASQRADSSAMMYFERQERQFCAVHSFNNCLGRQYPGLSGTSLLDFMDILSEIPGSGALNCYHRHVGNYCIAALNTWLYIHSAPAQRYVIQAVQSIARDSYTPTHAHAHARSHTRSYHIGLGSTRDQILNLLPVEAQEGFIISYECHDGAQSFGHNACMRQVHGQWYLIDSMRTGPKLLSSDQDWSAIYGDIYTIQQGDAIALRAAVFDLMRAYYTHVAPSDPHATQTLASLAAHIPAPFTMEISGTPVQPDQQPAAPIEKHESKPAHQRRMLPPHAQTKKLTARAERLATTKAIIKPHAKRLRSIEPLDKHTQQGPNLLDLWGMATSKPPAQQNKNRQPPAAAAAHSATTAPATATPPGVRRQPPVAETTDGAARINIRFLVHNVSGFDRSANDVQHLLEQYNPDVCIFTETHIPNRKNAARHLRATFSMEYKYWQSHSIGGATHTGILIAIRKRYALLGNATMVMPTSDLQGRLLTIQLKLPHSRPLEITSVYAPAQQTTEALATRKKLYEAIGTRLAHSPPDNKPLHIMAGDWNATIVANDRSSKNEYPADMAHRDFLSKHGLTSLDGCATRQHTYFHGVSQDGQNPTSRIDDIYAQHDANHKLSAPFLIPEDGLISDHRPIIYDMSAPAAMQVLPAPSPPPARVAQRVLVRPVDMEDKAKFRAATSDPATALGQQINALHTRLDAINSKSLGPYFAEIEHADGKQPNRLGTLEARPARHVIDELANELESIMARCMTTAMQTCKTKMTNPAGTHYRPRTQIRHRNKLCTKLKALRALAAVARQQCLTNTEMNTYVNANTADMPSDVDKIWNELQATLKPEPQVCSSTETPSLQDSLKNALHMAQQQIRAIDQRHAKHNAKQAAKSQQHLIASNPKQAHREIFRDPDNLSAGNIEALSDPYSGEMTSDPSRIQKITEKFFENQLAPPNFKTGKYLPHEAPRNYPFEAPGAVDSFQLWTDASHAPTRRWLHSTIVDKAAFHDCMNSLRNAKTPGPDGMSNEL